jgi:hypothetical protein
MSQNSSSPSTPPSNSTPEETATDIDPSNNINGPKQHANIVCRSDDYYCDPCIAAKHSYLPPGLDTSSRGYEAIN